MIGREKLIYDAVIVWERKKTCVSLEIIKLARHVYKVKRVRLRFLVLSCAGLVHFFCRSGEKWSQLSRDCNMSIGGLEKDLMLAMRLSAHIICFSPASLDRNGKVSGKDGGRFGVT